MSFWQILGRFAVSDTGETLQKVSDTTSVSSDGTTYTKMGSTTVGSVHFHNDIQRCPLGKFSRSHQTMRVPLVPRSPPV